MRFSLKRTSDKPGRAPRNICGGKRREPDSPGPRCGLGVGVPPLGGVGRKPPKGGTPTFRCGRSTGFAAKEDWTRRHREDGSQVKPGLKRCGPYGRTAAALGASLAKADCGVRMGGPPNGRPRVPKTPPGALLLKI